jgi:hypothetical protein
MLGFPCSTKSPNQARASCTQGVQAVNRYPLSLSLSRAETPILTPSRLAFEASVGSLIAFLLDSCWTHHIRLFSSTLIIMVFDHSRSRWFKICTCTSIPEDLPPSLVKRRNHSCKQAPRGLPSSLLRLLARTCTYPLCLYYCVINIHPLGLEGASSGQPMTM